MLKCSKIKYCNFLFLIYNKLNNDNKSGVEMTENFNEDMNKNIIEALQSQPQEEADEFDFTATEEEDTSTLDAVDELNATAEEETTPVMGEEDFSMLNDLTEDSAEETPATPAYEAPAYEAPVYEAPVHEAPVFESHEEVSPHAVVEKLADELYQFEIPSNVAVLKKLISQLPSGVTRQTGAQIIKQTMDALGISMKSVLQDAQAVQEKLNNSAKECQATIQEYKRQIATLEEQASSYKKQYNNLNDLVSLFIQHQ